MQDVLSKTNYEAQRQEAVQKEREELHNISKNMVKNWENTIEVIILSWLVFLVDMMKISGYKISELYCTLLHFPPLLS